MAEFIASRTDIPLGRIELIKGIGFVLITFTLLYVLIRRSIAALLERERKIQRLNRVYSVLSGINAAILRIRDKQPLLDETCRIATEYGKYPAAGIRLINEETGTVETVAVAAAGEALPFIEDVKITLPEDDPRSRGPTGTALREGRHVIVNDISMESSVEPWRAISREYGIESCAALPLTVNNNTVGALTLYSREPNAFDEDEVKLLDELAADTSLGLTYIENAHQLSYASTHNAVTGLPNWQLLEERVEQSIAGYGYRTDRVTALMVISLENYRNITDIRGVSLGDKIMRELASHLTQFIRSGDAIAHVESHDFVVLLTDIANLSDLATVARRLFVGLPQSITMNNADVMLHYRAGIAVHPRDGTGSEELLRHAKLALSSAREMDEPIKYYSKMLEDRYAAEHTIERELQGAIKNGELKLYYQPIVDIQMGKKVGYEALLRWNNERLGMVPPAEFIPIAEQTGLIISIGYWILREAAGQLKEWHDKGMKDIYISINISPRQLRQKGVARRIIDILQKQGIDLSKGKIVLEITESALMDNPDAMISELKILRKAGILIYIDDFGTGYSSLSYLRRYAVNVLKIDREFINGLPHDAGATALVKGIIGVAKSIDLKVVAEGVEAEEQYATLKELGCDMAQGYWISKPVPPHEISPDHWLYARSVNP